jgi:CheY-like chemotaxis protein
MDRRVKGGPPRVVTMNELILIVEAGDGAQGVRMAREFQPDLILMDVQLPVMDGIAATRRLAGEPSTRRIPVVALTAYAMPGDRERILAAGCRGYISKPVSIPDLLAKIAAYKEPDHE